MCTACWFDLTDDERAAVRLAQESPLRPELQSLEWTMAMTAAAQALARRRFRKAAARRLKQIRKAA